MSIEIPVGLTELLQGYTVEVLRQRPSDLVDFAVQYFTRLRDTRSQDGASTGGKTGKGVMFDGEPMQTESNGEDDEDDDSDFERRLIFLLLRLSAVVVQVLVWVKWDTMSDCLILLGKEQEKVRPKDLSLIWSEFIRLLGRFFSVLRLPYFHTCTCSQKTPLSRQLGKADMI